MDKTNQRFAKSEGNTSGKTNQILSQFLFELPPLQHCLSVAKLHNCLLFNIPLNNTYNGCNLFDCLFCIRFNLLSCVWLYRSLRHVLDALSDNCFLCTQALHTVYIVICFDCQEVTVTVIYIFYKLCNTIISVCIT